MNAMLRVRFSPPQPGRDPLGINSRFGTSRGLVRLILAHTENAIGANRRYRSIDWSRVTRLVFVCTGNICRSPYAEVRARALGMRAASFGLSTSSGLPAYDMARAAAARRGIDLDAHRSHDAKDFQIEQGDLLIAMEPRQGRQMLERFAQSPCQFTLLGLWSKPMRPHIHDPHRLSAAYFDTCFAVIDSSLDTLAQRINRAAFRRDERD